MARLNDDAQWIVLMGFLVSFGFFFLALVLNQSTVVGQTTAESVIEFPKNDIRDMRSVIIDSVGYYTADPPAETKFNNIRDDLTAISLIRKNAVLSYADPIQCVPNRENYCTSIHYNNGVTSYNESWISP
jgi:hypothetical protein